MDNITGNRIKELRLKLNLTQEKLGDILHVTKQSVSKWERGTNIPEPPILKQLANIFNCSTDYLLGTTDVKNYTDNISSGTGALVNTLTPTKEDTQSSNLTDKEKKDIAKQVEDMLTNIDKVDGLEFYNQPQDEEDMDYIRRGLKRFLEDVKIYNKVKYNPKKNKK